MPQMLRMPSEDDLPRGPKRAFVAELFIYFRAAGRPSPASIAAAAAQLDAPTPVAVSRETVRKLLKGETNSTWPKVKAVHEVLCRMAEQDPAWRRFPGSGGYDDDDDDTRTLRDYIRDLWNNAVDGVEPDEESGPPQLPPTPQASPPTASSGGWGSNAPSGGWGASQQTSNQQGYSAEPPF